MSWVRYHRNGTSSEVTEDMRKLRDPDPDWGPWVPLRDVFTKRVEREMQEYLTERMWGMRLSPEGTWFTPIDPATWDGRTNPHTGHDWSDGEGQPSDLQVPRPTARNLTYVEENTEVTPGMWDKLAKRIAEMATEKKPYDKGLLYDEAVDADEKIKWLVAQLSRLAEQSKVRVEIGGGSMTKEIATRNLRTIAALSDAGNPAQVTQVLVRELVRFGKLLLSAAELGAHARMISEAYLKDYTAVLHREIDRQESQAIAQQEAAAAVTKGMGPLVAGDQAHLRAIVAAGTRRDGPFTDDNMSPETARHVHAAIRDYQGPNGMVLGFRAQIEKAPLATQAIPGLSHKQYRAAGNILYQEQTAIAQAADQESKKPEANRSALCTMPGCHNPRMLYGVMCEKHKALGPQPSTTLTKNPMLCTVLECENPRHWGSDTCPEHGGRG